MSVFSLWSFQKCHPNSTSPLAPHFSIHNHQMSTSIVKTPPEELEDLASSITLDYPPLENFYHMYKTVTPAALLNSQGSYKVFIKKGMWRFLEA